MRLLTLVTTLLLTAFVYADVVETKGGDHLTGKVKGIAGGKVLLDTNYAGTMGIDVAQIASVTTDSDLTADTKSEQRVSGRVQGLNIMTQYAPVPISDVAVAGPDAASLDAGKGWKVLADAGASISKGNTDTKDYVIHAEGALALKETRHLLTASLHRSESAGNRTRDDRSAGYELNWLLDQHWYFAGNLGYFADTIKDVKYRITVGAGLGYLFYDTPSGRFAVDLGAAEVFEDLKSGSDQNPALRWGLRFNHFLIPDKLEFFHSHSILVLADTKRGLIFDSSTGLRMHLNDHLNAGVSVDLRDETKPAPGRKKVDTIYALTAGYHF